MSMGITAAFAEDYSITVTNDNDAMSINGKTYYAYKVFNLTLGDATTTTTGEGDDAVTTTTYGAYAYSIKNTDWAWATLTAEATTDATTKVITTKYGIKLIPSASDPTTYVVDGKTMTEANARALADKLQAVLPGTSNAAGSAVAANEKATISLTAPGYYAVYGVVYPTDPLATEDPVEEVVAAVALTTTDPSADVKPKASVPTLNKKITSVKEGTNTVDGAVLDADGQAAVAKIGSTVSYRIDSVFPNTTGYTDYTFTISDKITSGLDYVTNSFKISYSAGKETTITPTFATDSKSFTFTIPFATLTSYPAGSNIVLTYDCTVNDSALNYDYENNTAQLEYSHSPYDKTTNKTPEKETYVLDINIDVNKVAESASGDKLSGAEFKLYRLTSDGSTKQYYKWDTANKVVTWVDTQAAGDTFTTGSNGKLTQQVRGLDKGDYYLEETKAPTGYNLLAAPAHVVINVVEGTGDNANKVTYSATVDGATSSVENGVVDLVAAQNQNQPVVDATIVNNSGTVLPSTGGIGTTIFYVVGSILVVAAGVLLITKKRMSREG